MLADLIESVVPNHHNLTKTVTFIYDQKNESYSVVVDGVCLLSNVHPTIIGVWLNQLQVLCENHSISGLNRAES
jgi:hypothetical protein